RTRDERGRESADAESAAAPRAARSLSLLEPQRGSAKAARARDRARSRELGRRVAARAARGRLHRMIALNDLRRQHAPLRAALDAAIARVNDRGHYILGPEVDAFEREFAAYCGAAACVAVGNGTDALELALRALDVGEADEVTTVANAGGYATTAIR